MYCMNVESGFKLVKFKLICYAGLAFGFANASGFVFTVGNNQLWLVFPHACLNL